MTSKQNKSLLSDVHVVPRFTRPEQRVMPAPVRPQQYVSDIVVPARPTQQPQPYARFYRPAAHPDLRKPDMVVVYKTIKVPMPVPFSVLSPAPVISSKPVIPSPDKIANDALKVAKEMVQDVTCGRTLETDSKPKVTDINKQKSPDIKQPIATLTYVLAPLAMDAVRNAKPLPRQEQKVFKAPSKKAKGKRSGRIAKRTANVLIAVAVIMSGVMGTMIYEYHLALQKVEAKPLNASVEDKAPEAAAVAGPAAATVAVIAETKPAATGGGGGKLPASTPYKLSIPKLKVSANILGIGNTKSGAMSVPGNIWQVGWYKTSATPADNTGVVVMNGHVHGPTQPGVFANLTKLNEGDTVTVTDAGGKTYTYKVVSKQTIKAGEAGDEVLQSGSATKQGLNLVTCTGKIVEDKYQDRLVVYTERV